MERSLVTFVTGATGLVGNNVVRALLDAGRAVRVLARDNADPRPLEGLNVEMFRGDVRDTAAVGRAVRGADRVVHAAGYVRIGWTKMDQAWAINVEGTRNVAEAAHAEGVKLVHVSSIDALGAGSRQHAADEETAPAGGVLCPYVVTKSSRERAA